MANEHTGRIHGDGHILLDAFDRSLNPKEQVEYSDLLTSLLEGVGSELKFEPDNTDLPKVLLTLRQRMEIGFSNGCPFPEKAIKEFLLEQKSLPKSLSELAEALRKSSIFDGNHSMLFQLLLENAPDSLKNELQSYHSPWTKLSDQENRNLPMDITEKSGRGAYGMAYDPPYFNSIIPLKYIKDEDRKSTDTREDRFWKVIGFFETKAININSIDELVAKTQGFLDEEKHLIGEE